MAKKYFAVYQRGKLVQHMKPNAPKMPLILLSRKEANKIAAQRTRDLKKPNKVKVVTI